MIQKRTALILGAGASRNFGYPLGTELKNYILGIIQPHISTIEKIQEKVEKYPGSNIDPVTANNRILQELGRHPIENNHQVEKNNLVNFLLNNCQITARNVIDFYNHFRKSHLNSIDAFLEGRPEFLKLGHTLIAIAIMKHEVESNLVESPKDNRNWYNYLLNQMGNPWEEFRDNQLAIITYNYDRTLEHYFVHSLINTLGKDQKEQYAECIEIAKRFKLYHVHGSVAKFTWGIGKEARSYWTKMNCYEVQTAAESIQVISQVNAERSYEPVYEILDWAEQIFILGFGFDPKNLERLKLHTYNKPIYATRMGLSDREITEINSLCGNKIHFSSSEDYDILDFFKRDVGLSGIKSMNYERNKHGLLS